MMEKRNVIVWGPYDHVSDFYVGDNECIAT